MKENIVKEKSIRFALDIIRLYKQLQSEKEYVISKQVLRSGTSIGANIAEAGAAQSRKDFISKMSIASKEARETHYWLVLLDRSEITSIPVSNYMEDISDLINTITKIVKTTFREMK